MVAHAHSPSIWESEAKWFWAQGQSGPQVDTIFHKSKTKPIAEVKTFLYSGSLGNGSLHTLPSLCAQCCYPWVPLVFLHEACLPWLFPLTHWLNYLASKPWSHVVVSAFKLPQETQWHTCDPVTLYTRPSCSHLAPLLDLQVKLLVFYSLCKQLSE